MQRYLAAILAVLVMALLGAGCQGMGGTSGPAMADFQTGRKALDMQDPDRAVDMLSRSLKYGSLSDQAKAQAFYNRGIAYTRLSELYLALADFDQAILLDPNFSAAYNNRGALYNRLSQFDKAIADLDMAIRLDPEQSAAYYNRSYPLAAQGKDLQAIADLEMALKLSPGNDVYRNRLNALRQPAQRFQPRSEQRGTSKPAPLATGKLTGTGFVVSSQGHVLTNLHVIKDAREIRAPGQDMPLTVQAVDALSDLALLQLPRAIDGDKVASFPQDRNPRPGDSVVVVGFPLAGLLASGPSVSSGTISALAGPANNPNLLQITAPVQPGNSGGPLLDQGGKVIGVVVGKLDAAKVAQAYGETPQNVNFAISGAVAKGFLETNGVMVRSLPEGAALSPADIAEKASGFVVLLECYR
jgi:S1-C subfamily serine protease